MDTLLQDLRFAMRMLVKNPGFTAVAALTLALGIGANTAIFSVVNATLLRPLPYAEPDRLSFVTIDRMEHGRRFTVSKADFLILKEQMQGFETLAAVTADRLNLTGVEEPERVSALWVTADFFSVLGVPPVLGRGFAADEDRPGRPPVAVVSHGLWQRHLAGDPGAIGRAITLNDQTFTVVGVMPKDFTFLRPNDVWPILQLTPPTKRPPFLYRLVGRLKPGVGEPQLRAELAAMHDRVEAVWPDPQKTGWSFEAEPLKEFITGGARPALLVLWVAVGFVLLIATANVANLLLSRAATREREIAVRTALGAPRRRLVRQLLTESVILAGLGGGLGLMLALWGIDLLSALEPGTLPRMSEVRIDGGVLLFTLLLSLASGVLFGLAPALQVSRARVNQTLKEGGRAATETRGRRRLRGLLVIGQMALALMLLVAAGLMVRSFMRLQRVDPGFDPEGLLTVQLSLSQARYPEAQQKTAFYRRLLERARSLPGVRGASVSDSIPPDRLGILEMFEVEGQPVPTGQSLPMAEEVLIGTDYFRTLGIPLLKGRPPAPQDNADAPPVAWINETMARRYFPDGDAVGKRLHAGGFGPEDPWITVAGVAGDVKYNGLAADRAPTIYVPYEQQPFWDGEMHLAVRSSAEPASLIETVRREVRALDPGLPLASVKTGEQLLAQAVGRPRFQTLLIGIFALAALLLAAVGIYGVISYSATQRTQEIGLRMALGARSRDVILMVVGQGMRLALAGTGLGVMGALGLTWLMRGLLFGVSATDPLTFALIAAILAGVALLASYLPARRASGVDPMIALRSE
ncbi:MAG TPA: ABC transporter permease [Candidatus Polarisedimenticolia bacterium]|jgi:putative ABC transport system permease protein|nr:ABC transporter permease [Candidatus Polarisedimenticolia bacterium]